MPQPSLRTHAELAGPWAEVLAHLGADEYPAAAQMRVSVRAVTPDRLPLAGPVADAAFFNQAYGGLAKGRPGPFPPARYAPGLFVLSGLGSRGYTTAPLAAELIASMICGDPLPMEYAVRAALHPGRFLIRDLMRGRITDK